MSVSIPKALVIEDNTEVAELVRLHLEMEGFAVTIRSNGLKGLELARTGEYPLIVLDLMLPGCSGTEVCRELRQNKVACRIMMLTEKDAEIDKVLGLELGADDYVTKPFSVRELVARAKALLRRDERASVDREATILEIGPLQVCPSAREARINGQTVVLTCTEFDLLHFMSKNPGQAFSRDQLLRAVWGYTSNAYEQTVNTHINRLRSKIESDPANPKFIQTVWGVGYKCVSKYEG